MRRYPGREGASERSALCLARVSLHGIIYECPPPSALKGPLGEAGQGPGRTDTPEVHTYRARPGGWTGYEQVTRADVQATLSSPGPVV